MEIDETSTLHRQHSGRQPLQEVAVMRGDHERSGEFQQCRLQGLARGNIQMIGRLIQQQEVRLIEQQLRQVKALAFSARQHPYVLEDFLSTKEEASQIGPRLLGRHRAPVEDLVQDSVIVRQRGRGLLGKVPRPKAYPGRHAAGGGRLQPGQHLQERGLTGAVGAHQADALPAIDLQVDPGEDVRLAVPLHHGLQSHYRAPGWRHGAGDHTHDRLTLRWLDRSRRETSETLLPAFCLGGPVPRTIPPDVRLEFLHFLLAAVIGLRLLLDLLRLEGGIDGVRPWKGSHEAALQLEGPRGDRIQQAPVVADDDGRTGK